MMRHNSSLVDTSHRPSIGHWSCSSDCWVHDCLFGKAEKAIEHGSSCDDLGQDSALQAQTE